MNVLRPGEYIHHSRLYSQVNLVGVADDPPESEGGWRRYLLEANQSVIGVCCRVLYLSNSSKLEKRKNGLFRNILRQRSWASADGSITMIALSLDSDLEKASVNNCLAFRSVIGRE